MRPQGGNSIRVLLALRTDDANAFKSGAYQPRQLAIPLRGSGRHPRIGECNWYRAPVALGQQVNPDLRFHDDTQSWTEVVKETPDCKRVVVWEKSMKHARAVSLNDGFAPCCRHACNKN